MVMEVQQLNDKEMIIEKIDHGPNHEGTRMKKCLNI
jgi:hypothetical protein